MAEGLAPALSVSGIQKDYGFGPALAGVSFSVGRGERVALLGANGAGKSTLLRIVAGLAEPDGGEARVLGAKAGSLEARAATSYLPDQPVLYDDLSVMEQLEYVARLHGSRHWAQRADKLLERLGIAERAGELPLRFSRGLRQKAAVAMAMIRPFGLLAVDEPFVGLDQSGRAALIELVDEAAASGAGVVMATHQLDYLERADRCVVLSEGEVAYDGAPSAGLGEMLG